MGRATIFNFHPCVQKNNDINYAVRENGAKLDCFIKPIWFIELWGDVIHVQLPPAFPSVEMCHKYEIANWNVTHGNVDFCLMQIDKVQLSWISYNSWIFLENGSELIIDTLSY